MFFATGVVTIGLLLSFLIPTVRLAQKRDEIPATDDPLDLAAMVADA